MTIGMIILIVVAILILLGVGQRVLDRLRLNDKLALLFIALIIGLGFVPDIRVTDVFAFNLGGAVVPLALCIYLFVKADTAWERWRSILASIVTGAAIFAIGMFAPDEPETITVDPIILYGLAAGLIAYIFGRSRRCASTFGSRCKSSWLTAPSKWYSCIVAEISMNMLALCSTEAMAASVALGIIWMMRPPAETTRSSSTSTPRLTSDGVCSEAVKYMAKSSAISPETRFTWPT